MQEERVAVVKMKQNQRSSEQVYGDEVNNEVLGS